LDESNKGVRKTFLFTEALWSAVEKAAAKQGVEPYQVVMNATTDYVIQAETLDEYTKAKVLTGRYLIQEAVDTARKLCRESKFSEHITRDTFRECMKNARWAKAYEEYIEANPYQHGIRLKAINKEIGFYIRAGIGGIVDKSAKPLRTNSDVIQSYTGMVDYSREAVT
jgi:hypothetical protein